MRGCARADVSSRENPQILECVWREIVGDLSSSRRRETRRRPVPNSITPTRAESGERERGETGRPRRTLTPAGARQAQPYRAVLAARPRARARGGGGAPPRPSARQTRPHSRRSSPITGVPGPRWCPLRCPITDHKHGVLAWPVLCGSLFACLVARAPGVVTGGGASYPAPAYELGR